MQTQRASSQTEIKSESVEFHNRDGRRISAWLDSPLSHPADPIVLLPPAYGETKRDSLLIAYTLAANGFRSLRYDSTDSVGESEGEMLRYSMVTAKNDILSALDFIEKNHGQPKTAVVASSLAARQAIKAASEDPRISFVAGLVGVVDLQATLGRIYGEDVIGKLSEGQKLAYEVVNTFGFDMNVEGLRSSIVGEMHTKNTTIKDLGNTRAEIVLYFAEKDPWVKESDVHADKLKHVHKRIIQDGMHELRENPRAVKYLLSDIVGGLKRFYSRPAPEPVAEPDIRQLARQNKMEKERFKIYQINRENESAFWKNYLTGYDVIEKTPDFKELTEILLQYLRPFEKGDVLLDVGCGIGLFGNEVIRKYSGKERFVYIAQDLIPEAVDRSLKRNALEASTVRNGARKNPQMVYSIGDADNETARPLLADHSVSKICCNLVLSYLFDPKNALTRLGRLLAPNGKIVITSLKPFADLSPIYSNLIKTSKNEETLSRARELLHSAGTIKQKEKDGHYRFYSEEELKNLLAECGFSDIQTACVFSNQVVLATAQKR